MASDITARAREAVDKWGKYGVSGCSDVDESAPTLVADLLAEVGRLRGRLGDLADEPYLSDRLREARADRDELRTTLARIREALARHPRCDIHPDDDPVTCGWKRAVADIQTALDGDGGE